MPALSNPRWERFARAWVELAMSPEPTSTIDGGINGAAFTRAGFTPSIYNAGKLRKKRPVEDRINELMAEALEYSDVRIQRAAIQLDRIASASIRDFRDGKKWKDLDKLEPRLADAIRKVEYHIDGSIARIELHDKVRALTILMKHLGGIPEEQTGMQQQFNTQVIITDEQRVAALMTMLAKAKTEPVAATAQPVLAEPEDDLMGDET